MEKINPYSFYSLGLEFQPLRELGGKDVPRGAALFPILNATSAVARLLNGDPIRLGVSRSAAASLKAQIDRFFSLFRDEKGGIKFPEEDAPPISSWDWSLLISALDTFQTVFRAEMETATTYYVPRRGIYSTTELVESAEETFPPDLAPYISDKTKADFHAAGRCLAFNLPTAAGFHAARGIEGTLELYWQTFTGNTGTLNGWNDYIVDLRAIIDAAGSPCPAERTVETLQLIKDYDRNPVMHPRVILSEADARILFSSSESVVMAMAQENRIVKAQGLSASLLLIPPTGTP